MQQTPWDFIPWRFILLILAHIQAVCKIVIFGKNGYFFFRWKFTLCCGVATAEWIRGAGIDFTGGKNSNDSGGGISVYPSLLRECRSGAGTQDGNHEVPTPEPRSPAPSTRQQHTEGLRAYRAAVCCGRTKDGGGRGIIRKQFSALRGTAENSFQQGIASQMR